MASTQLSAPPRGTRPRDRRAQIRAAATRLFYERGYERVSVADVAASVNVGPSALYRHYAGKADMLYDAIDNTATAFTSMLGELQAGNLEEVATTCARTALAYRRLGVLWQREARNLPTTQQDLLRSRMRGSGTKLSSTLAEIRPELGADQADFLAGCAVNAVSSISFHRLQLAPERFEEVLADLALRVLTFEFADSPAHPPNPHPTPTAAPVSRRDEIVAAAATLFATHGFDAVGIDDIGATVGMAGPSIYTHFTSKQHLLYAGFERGYAVLQKTFEDAVQKSPTPVDALRRVSDSYVGLTLRHTDLITLLIAESPNLGPEYQHLAQRAQLGYISQWVGLLQEIRPSEDITVSRIKVQSAQMTANSLSRTLYLRDRPGFDADVAQICWLQQQ